MFKDILVCISEEHGRENLIRTASEFASSHDAQLHGMFVSIHSEGALPPYGLVAVDYSLRALEHDKQLSTDAAEQFKTITKQHGLSTQWIDNTNQKSAMQVAKYMNLIVASQLQTNPQFGDNSFALLNPLVLESGKPVMLIPLDWQGGAPGQQIVLAWDQSRESVRAVADSLPLLQNANTVNVVTVTSAHDDVKDLSQINKYLTDRGVNSEFHNVTKDKSNNTTTKAIQAQGTALGADLYVLGGYGHSRLREMVLGGVTRQMMKNSNTPVLLSH